MEGYGRMQGVGGWRIWKNEMEHIGGLKDMEEYRVQEDGGYKNGGYE